MAKIIICKDCGEKREQHAKGLCSLCYLHWYYRNNAEKLKAQAREYRKINKERNQEQSHAYYREHCEEIKARSRAYYRETREQQRAYRRQYYIEHRNEFIARAELRRSQKQSVPNTLSPYDIQRIKSMGRCFYCNTELAEADICLDHFVPISHQGGTTRANIIPCCYRCNNKKKDLLPQNFLIQLRLI